MGWHVRHNRSLHQHIFILTVATRPFPWIANESRITVEQVAPDFWRGIAQYGFMERPDVPSLLKQTQALGCNLPFDDVTFYIGHETIVARQTGRGLPPWQEPIFAALARNATHGSDYLQLPEAQTVEIGRRVAV
jgi:KUP system potassium uptake protein